MACVESLIRLCGRGTQEVVHALLGIKELVENSGGKAWHLGLESSFRFQPKPEALPLQNGMMPLSP